MTDFDEIRQRMDLLSDEELLSIIREHDENQWRPEVFDIVRAILSGRGRSPDKDAAEVSGFDEAEEPSELDLVTVATYPSSVDAETDRLALVTNGVEAWVVESCSAMGVHLGTLKVRPGDLNAAVKLLDPEVLEQPVPSSDLPDEIAEPPCPKCGSRNVMESAEIAEDPAFPQEWLYHCASCGHKWHES